VKPVRRRETAALEAVAIEADRVKLEERREAALAAALATQGEGEWITIHDLDCDVDDDAEIACSCRPMLLRCGAEA